MSDLVPIRLFHGRPPSGAPEVLNLAGQSSADVMRQFLDQNAGAPDVPSPVVTPDHMLSYKAAKAAMQSTEIVRGA